MNKCATCDKEFYEGDKVIQDRYFFGLHCSEECLIKYMYEFFAINDATPNVIIKDGYVEYIEEED